jgi:hypothetical protein
MAYTSRYAEKVARGTHPLPYSIDTRIGETGKDHPVVKRAQKNGINPKGKHLNTLRKILRKKGVTGNA